MTKAMVIEAIVNGAATAEASADGLGTILFVDDDAALRRAAVGWLRLSGFQVEAQADGPRALERLHQGFAGIVVTDLRMPGMDGMELLRRVQAIDPELPVVMVTAHGDVSTAVEAMRLGAHDFLEKPLLSERLSEVATRALATRRLVMENRRLRLHISEHGLAARIIGTSRAAEALRHSVAQLAATDASVILFGESGSGKDLVARSLHEEGPRRRANFVAVNCAAIPETMFESEFFGHEAGAFTGAMRTRVGKLEYAHRGTLFLDEIESMPLSMQAKLLRALQERSVERLGANRSVDADVRVIAATKTDLQAASAAGSFRMDLYYRLSIVELSIPPLRDRPEDILLLFDTFVLAAARRQGLEPRPVPAPLAAALAAQAWPGNVRELRNAAERHALGIGSPLLRGAVPVVSMLPLSRQVEEFERLVIERALNDAKGRVNVAMERLGLPRRTLNEKMGRYGLDRQHFIG